MHAIIIIIKAFIDIIFVHDHYKELLHVNENVLLLLHFQITLAFVVA